MNTFCPVEIIIELPFIKSLLGTRHWPKYFTNIFSFNPEGGLVREVWLFRTQTLRHDTISWKSYSLEVEKSKIWTQGWLQSPVQKCLQANRESFKVFADFLKQPSKQRSRWHAQRVYDIHAHPWVQRWLKEPPPPWRQGCPVESPSPEFGVTPKLKLKEHSCLLITT